MEKSRYVRVNEVEEVKGDDPTECFLPNEVGITFELLEGVMVIEVPRIKRFLKEGRMEGEKILVMLSFEEEQIGGP